MKLTRVLRGAFFPSKNETRLAPFAFGALNFTRTRRGIRFPSRNETLALRLATMSEASGGMPITHRLIRFKRAGSRTESRRRGAVRDGLGALAEDAMAPQVDEQGGDQRQDGQGEQRVLPPTDGEEERDERVDENEQKDRIQDATQPEADDAVPPAPHPQSDDDPQPAEPREPEAEDHRIARQRLDLLETGQCVAGGPLDALDEGRGGLERDPGGDRDEQEAHGADEAEDRGHVEPRVLFPEGAEPEPIDEQREGEEQGPGDHERTREIDQGGTGGRQPDEPVERQQVDGDREDQAHDPPDQPDRGAGLEAPEPLLLIPRAGQWILPPSWDPAAVATRGVDLGLRPDSGRATGWASRTARRPGSAGVARGPTLRSGRPKPRRTP